MKIKGSSVPVEILANNDAIKPVEKNPEREKSKIGVESLKNAPKLDEESLKQATELLNRAMKISNYHLEFKAYKDSGRYQVRVVDSESQKVIRELPPDDVLDFQTKVIAMLDKMIGLLVDEIA